MKREKPIQALLSLLVLVALFGAWTGEIVHVLLVPHHYCLAHDEISHEVGHNVVEDGWNFSDAVVEDHCSILGNFLRSATLTSRVLFSEQRFAHAETSHEPISFFPFNSVLFLLAPKNSPPISA